MPSWRGLVRGLQGLLQPARAHRETREEVEQYLAELEAEYRDAGVPADEARRQAQLAMGGVAQVTESVRASGWEGGVESVWADLRYAGRRLVHDPLFTLLTAVTLGLGIAASTAILSVVRPVLLQPLPYPSPERVVAVWDQGADHERADVTFGTYDEIRARARAFEALAVFMPWQPTLTGQAEPERLEGQRVSWTFFQVLGLSPAMGRSFAPADDRAGAPEVVLLSDRLWRRRFAADPGILGREITFGDERFTIIGVMPAGFENVLAPGAEAWAPLRYELSEGRAWGHHLRMVGRLRPAVPAPAASRELAAIAAQPVAEFPRRPWASLERGLLLVPLHADLTRGMRPALLAVLGAVALLLLIAAVNGTTLVLARGIRRRGEFAVRAALGAGRGRLVRQLVIEHVALALVGGGLGALGAVAGVKALQVLSPPELPRLEAIRVEGTLLATALMLAVAAGVVFGLVVALQGIAASGWGTLQVASRRVAGGHLRVRAGLVVAQVALALVLLAGSGLLLRSMARLLAVDPGFDPDHRLTLQVQLAGARYAADSSTWRFFEEALEAVRKVPGVRAAALTSQLPLSGDMDLYGVRLDPPVSGDPGETRGTFRYAVSPGYFAAMGIPLRAGRLLDAADRAGAEPVVVISEALARTRFAGHDPLGQLLRIGEGWPYRVVGVVGDVRQESLALEDASAVYTTLSQWRFADSRLSLVIHSAVDPAGLAPAVRKAIRSVDPDQAVVRVATMEMLIARSAAARRFTLLLFGGFALAALLLASAGVYGLAAASVVERTREFGVRAALGASPGRIVGLVLSQGARLAATGVALGLAGALALGRFLQAMLFGVSPLDPITYGGVLLTIAVMALAASLLPAWRAARTSPAGALRAE